VPDVVSDALPQPVGSVAPPRPGWKSKSARFISLGVSAALLIALYNSVDLRLVGQTLRGASVPWLVLSLSMIVPITILRAVRFLLVSPPGTLPGLAEALRLTLVASALNVFLPAKSGDLVKSYFVMKRGTTAGVGIAIAVYERLCDVFGLMFWCMAGWFIARPVVARVPSALWPVLGTVGAVCGVLILSLPVARFLRAATAKMIPHPKLKKLIDLVQGWPDLLARLRGRRRWVVLFSMFLWLVHVVQIWMFTVALPIDIPFTACASLTAVALMAGQMPFTLGGLGARDVALVVLLSGYITPEAAVALGILISTRGFLPPLAALPIMRPYLAAAVEDARTRRSATGS
jgi:uncharacterized protein (TIRG00374 family)